MRTNISKRLRQTLDLPTGKKNSHLAYSSVQPSALFVPLELIQRQRLHRLLALFAGNLSAHNIELFLR